MAGVVVEMMATAKRQEAEMTSDVLEALPDGARMHGLAFRMKSPESLARKLYAKLEADPFADLDETAGRIADVVRPEGSGQVPFVSVANRVRVVHVGPCAHFGRGDLLMP